jgi:hypothetical protein
MAEVDPFHVLLYRRLSMEFLLLGTFGLATWVTTRRRW